MKCYSLSCNYILEVPEEVKYEELQNDLSEVLIETLEAHKGRLSGKLSLIRCNSEGHVKQELK